VVDARCLLLSPADKRTFPHGIGFMDLAGWMQVGGAQRSRLSRGGGVNLRSDVNLKFLSEQLIE